eukprot:CAMPEP_0114561556 /NCGR_PEP_ID=MMETSP0114-20121206/12067_1 /TAXON_ID=31324 /ORGANISM="Goniomonas sp, Strain m" /LENGTH=138 /DNA_ID=CAMNT_0001747199 /DNA_START=180 /DNA_END=595 /DNA_ORIENTATION=-
MLCDVPITTSKRELGNLPSSSRAPSTGVRPSVSPQINNVGHVYAGWSGTFQSIPRPSARITVIGFVPVDLIFPLNQGTVCVHMERLRVEAVSCQRSQPLQHETRDVEEWSARSRLVCTGAEKDHISQLLASSMDKAVP